jgi:[ribosomal protein S5]-alanine N-acetyltransferase
VDPQFRPGFLPAPSELSDGTVLLRKWSYNDLPCIEEASRDPVIPSGTTVPRELSDDAGRAFIERQWTRWSTGEGLSLAVVEEATGAAAGMMCLLHRQQPGVLGVGYFTVDSHRRKGLTRRALVLLSCWAFGVDGVVRLEALVEPDNGASIKVLDGAGFRCEGLLRSYLIQGESRRDVLLFSLLKGDIRGESPGSIPL